MEYFHCVLILWLHLLSLDMHRCFRVSGQQMSWTSANASCKLAMPNVTSDRTVQLEKYDVEAFDDGEEIWLGYIQISYKPVCNHKWMYNPRQKSCYRVFWNVSSMSFFAAAEKCKNIGARLTDIVDKSEQYFLRELVTVQTDGGFYWDSLWTAGLENDADGTWNWYKYNTEMSTHLEWVPGQPDMDTTHYEENCVAFVIDREVNFGFLNDDNCYEPAANKGYICKKVTKSDPYQHMYGYMKIENGAGRLLYGYHPTRKRRFLCETERETTTLTPDITQHTIWSNVSDKTVTTVNIDREFDKGIWLALGIGIMIPALVLCVFLTFIYTRKRYLKENIEANISTNTGHTPRLYTDLLQDQQRNDGHMYNEVPSSCSQRGGRQQYTALIPVQKRMQNHTYNDLSNNIGIQNTCSTSGEKLLEEDDTYYSACV